MEALVVIGCAALAWVATYVSLAPGTGALVVPALAGWSRRAARAIDGLCGLLATSAVTARLVAVPSVAALCDAASAEAARRGRIGVTREGACGVLLLAGGGVSLLVSLAVGSLVGLVAVPLGCAAAVGTWDASRRRRLSEELSASMPSVFRTLAMALGAGETLAQSVEYVGAHEAGPAGRAFMRAALRMRCGASATDALEALSDELDAPGVELLVTALLVSQRTGSPLRGLFEYSATLVERSREFERMLMVKTAQVRLSVRIVSLLPVVMLVGLSLLSVDFRRGLATAPGMASVAVAAVMDATALVVIRRIMRGVL